jgi:CHAT domain-containing protein/lipopolysaccharide biosynthesis regulator YciM
VLKEFANDSTAPLRHCAAVVLAVMNRTPLTLPDDAPAVCRDYEAMERSFPSDPEARRRAAARLRRAFPETVAPRLTGLFLRHPSSTDETMIRQATVIIDEGPLTLRAYALSTRALRLHMVGRHDEALEDERRGLALTVKHPGARRIFLAEARNHEALATSGVDAQLRSHADSVRHATTSALGALGDSAPPRSRYGILHMRVLENIQRGNLPEAQRLADELVRASDALGDDLLRARSWIQLGRTLVKRGAHDAAERILLQTRALAPRLAAVDVAYEAEHNLLHLYEAQGRDRDAKQAGRAFVAHTMRAELNAVRMMSGRDFGWYLQRRGEPDAARPYFEQMVAAIDSLRDQGSENYFYAGEYFELIGDLDRATAYYGLDTTRTMRTRALEALTRIAEATADTQAALDRAREHDDLTVPGFPEKRMLLPGVLARAGRTAEAMERFSVARADAASRDARSAWARLTRELAEMELSQGHFAAARAHADSAAATAREVGDEDTALRARALSARARVSAGERDAVATLEQLRDRAARSRLLLLESDLTLMYGDALTVVGRPAAALSAYAHAQNLSDSVARSLAHDPTRASFRAAQLRPSTHAMRALLGSARDAAALARYAAWSVRRKGSATEAFAGLQRLRLTLPRGGVVVDYAVLDGSIGALVVTRDTVLLQRLPGDALAVQRTLAAFYANLPPRVGSHVDRRRGKFDRAAAIALYRELLAPVFAAVGVPSRLVIAPDAVLHHVPWDALVDGVSERMLLETTTVALVPSLAEAAAADAPPPSRQLVAVGTPDPAQRLAMRRELDGLAASWNARDLVRLDGDMATEAALKRLAGSAGILHIAAHAAPNVRAPDRAAVTLVSGEGEDGRLYAFELPQLRLRGALVVLSACESAVGRPLQGEGPLSLGRSFLRAGAGQVLLTLWPVSGEVSAVMEHFYRELAAGRTPADALRAAKLSAWRAGIDPLDWAVFTLVAGRA